MKNSASALCKKAAAFCALVSCGLLLGNNCLLAESVKSGALPGSLRPSKKAPSSPALLASGKLVYEKQCSPCHGLDGRGNGEAAYLLYPKPRDFVTPYLYRFVSTWERDPTDEDLYFTISRGIPGSAMPSWSHLPEETRWALVHYIKSFSGSFEAPATQSGKRSGIVEVPQEPPYTEEAAARAQNYFRDNCASCHGPSGRGDGVKQQFDNEGYPTRPRDLTQGIFKGSSEPQDIYRRIVLGIPGTPMPLNDTIYGESAWDLTHFILSLSSPEQRERVEMKKFRISAARVKEIPDHPDAGIWRDAPAVNLHMMPLWWRNDRPEILNVQAVHDGKELALRLLWTDDTDDHTAIKTQDFRDAAAIEISLEEDPPFFGMGQADHPVNIWMWKSERQADLEPVFQDIDRVYPNIGIDTYPNLVRSALEQPVRHALTLQSDPAFITGWGAGNIVSDPLRQSAVEDLVAQGFGTLKARPAPDQTVRAKGMYDVGAYLVMFRRAFKGNGGNSFNLAPGKTVRAAFAVWNGSAGDRDGKKSVTIWQDLVIAP